MLAGANSAAYIGTVAAVMSAAIVLITRKLTFGTHSDTKNKSSSGKSFPRFGETRCNRSSNEDYKLAPYMEVVPVVDGLTQRGNEDFSSSTEQVVQGIGDPDTE